MPSPASRPVQFIDARDLAAFVELAVTQQIAGVFNAVGPRERFSLGELADTCVTAAAERGVVSSVEAVDAQALIAQGVEPWSDIPLWIEDPAFVGMFEADNRKAIAAGLQLRLPIETVRALMNMKNF